MTQWLLCPNWEGMRRSIRDDIGRVIQQRFAVTIVRVTNPTMQEGRFSMLLHEARGGGTFVEAQYNSGTYRVPAMYQQGFRIDPGLYWGDRWNAFGWIDFWLSLDAMLIDVSILIITRNLIRSDPSAGGLVETRSTRTATLVPVRPPFPNRVIEWIMPAPPVPRHFQRGGDIIPLDRVFDDFSTPSMREG